MKVKNLYLKISTLLSSIVFVVFLALLITLVSQPLVYNNEYSRNREKLFFNKNGIVTTIVEENALQNPDFYQTIYEVYGNKLVIYNTLNDSSTIMNIDNLFRISVNGPSGTRSYLCTNGIIAMSFYTFITAASLTITIALSIRIQKKSKIE